METMLDRIYHMGVKHSFKAPEMVEDGSGSTSGGGSGGVESGEEGRKGSGGVEGEAGV